MCGGENPGTDHEICNDGRTVIMFPPFLGCDDVDSGPERYDS